MAYVLLRFGERLAERLRPQLSNGRHGPGQTPQGRQSHGTIFHPYGKHPARQECIALISHSHQILRKPLSAQMFTNVMNPII
jgi:hypothetical protein